MADSPQAIVDFLVNEYASAMNEKNEGMARLHKGNGSPPVIDIGEHVGKVDEFRTFAADYLSSHRPQSIQHGDGNYVIQLTNLKTFIIAPELVGVQGSMQESHAVPVTGVETAKDIQTFNRDHGSLGLSLPEPAKG